MTSIYKYEYLVCNNSFSRTFTKLPAFTNIGTRVHEIAYGFGGPSEKNVSPH